MRSPMICLLLSSSFASQIGDYLEILTHKTERAEGLWPPAHSAFGGWGRSFTLTGLILAEGLQRFVAQHPEVAVQRMLAFQERKDRVAPRRQLGHGDVQANIAPGILHS